MSNDTFLDEFEFLKKHLPEALYNNSNAKNNFFSEELFESIDKQLRSNSENNFMEADMILPPQPLIKSLEIKTDNFNDLYDDLFSNNQGENLIDSEEIYSLIEEYGRKAFGTYLPMHSHFENKRYPWGIYLFPQFILTRVQQLYDQVGKKMKLKLKDMQYAYSYAIFRHLLFHHQVERFSTKHEILTNTVNYKEYCKNVYKETAYTENWLEEALAEVAVLRSTHINKNVAMEKKLFQKLYKHDLKSMPPGNRDYECESFGGEDKAQQYFASQIIQCKKEVFPAPSTSICTVNANENQIKISKVPIYKVEFDIPERIRTPKEVVSRA